MSDEIALTSKTSRAARAQVLLNDDLLKEAFDKLDAEYMEAWRNSDPYEDDRRQRLWVCVKVVEKVKQHLGQALRDGKVAQLDLERIAAQKRGRR